MGAKNRTKRKHAVERRERRKAFFSASKVTRGEWVAKTTTQPRPRTDEHGAVENRKYRRNESRLARRELAAFRSGRWARDLAFAIRGFLRRTQPGTREPAPALAAA